MAISGQKVTGDNNVFAAPQAWLRFEAGGCARELAVGFLDLAASGLPTDTERLVRVAFVGRHSSFDSSGRTSPPPPPSLHPKRRAVAARSGRSGSGSGRRRAAAERAGRHSGGSSQPEGHAAAARLAAAARRLCFGIVLDSGLLVDVLEI